MNRRRKPILTVGFPYCKPEHLREIADNLNRKLGKDYYVICYDLLKDSETKIELLSTSKLTKVRYQELIKMIKDNVQV